ncbi:uncharacterized protein LOC110180566 [Drosophila serrata]|uniref:uncharacterized protein LOC110180566 n=1 Tax=Drosophila serrata TaxID=7274 RepID=UPI000A1D32A9|nr:uncharacterized protein LOC110180566 [Drosophila serrata]
MDLRLTHFWIFFLLHLLMVMSCGANGDQATNLPENCKFMLAESKIFQRWCIGIYPWTAHIKYQDKLIDVDEPYGLYLTRSQDSILVLHKESDLLKCRNIVF